MQENQIHLEVIMDMDGGITIPESIRAQLGIGENEQLTVKVIDRL